MKKIIKVRDLEIHKNASYICVPVVCTSESEILNSVKSAKEKKADLIEWRADFYSDLTNEIALNNMLKQLRDALENTPLLFTIRTHRDGGHAIDENLYIKLNYLAIHSGYVDLLDIEYSSGKAKVSELVSAARESGVVSVVSSHDFNATPPKSSMVEMLKSMSETGADITKLAVWPQSFSDVLSLMSATYEYANIADNPVITMSMSDIGKISRVTGALTGSVITFAAVEAESAPGQMSIERVREMIDIFKANTNF